MATFFSSSILNSPLLVLTVAVSFLLPITTIFAPSSLRVVPGPNQELPRSCQVPTGNLTNGSSGSIMYQTGGWGYWTGITPVAQKLAYSTFIGQKIPALPQPCGSNCTYSVSVPSIAFQCKEGVALPAAMTPATPAVSWQEAFWNASATISGSPPASFYVYWKSSTQSGTNGTALCTIGTAKYDFTVSIHPIIPTSTAPPNHPFTDTNSERATIRQLQRNADRRPGRYLRERRGKIAPK